MVATNPDLANQRLRAIGDRIREVRIERGLSQERLAELAGCHRTYLSLIELGKRNFYIGSLYAIADALGVEIADLVQSSPGLPSAVRSLSG